PPPPHQSVSGPAADADARPATWPAGGWAAAVVVGPATVVVEPGAPAEVGAEDAGPEPAVVPLLLEPPELHAATTRAPATSRSPLRFTRITSLVSPSLRPL